MRKAAKQLIHEVVGSESYDYYPLGDYVVSAPGICGDARPSSIPGLKLKSF